MIKYVRLANRNDAETLIMLNNEFIGPGVTLSEVQLSLANSSELVALAIRNGITVGFACAQLYKSFCYPVPQAEITEIYVRESARRNGLAAMLISFLEQELRSRGCSTIKILTGRNNEAAAKLYEYSRYVRKDYVAFQKELFN